MEIYSDVVNTRSKLDQKIYIDSHPPPLDE